MYQVCEIYMIICKIECGKFEMLTEYETKIYEQMQWPNSKNATDEY